MTACLKGNMPYDCMPKGEMPNDCMPRREMPFDWMPIYCPAIILYTFGVSPYFWSLESGHPEILQSPEFCLFQHVGYFFHSVFVEDLDFQCKIPKFHHSWNLPRTFLKIAPFFKQYQGLEYFSHSIFSLEFDYECSIQKFHHTWNFPGIIWNSGISLDVAYFLPNLTHWVSIQPNLIILYAFGVSLDL